MEEYHENEYSEKVIKNNAIKLENIREKVRGKYNKFMNFEQQNMRIKDIIKKN